MRIIIFILLSLFSARLSAQQNTKLSYVIVRDIAVEGNRKTKTNILTRELTFAVGDTIPRSKLATKLEDNRLRLINTNLFNVVKLNVKDWSDDNHATVVIEVVEAWFFYPVPIFELADRNFNVWWNTYHRALDRTNYGGRLSFLNATGRRDPIYANVQFGYTPRVALSYELPFINRRQTIGLFAGGLYAVNREVNYATVGNHQIFIKDSTQNLSQRINFEVGMTLTPELLSRHVWTLGFAQQIVDTSVINRSNQDFFLDNRTRQRYFWLSYNYSHDTRNIRPYPTNGHLASVNLTKFGLLGSDDVDALNLNLRWAQYIPLSKRFSLEVVGKAKTALIRGQQPYNFQRGLGYGQDFVRGYEYYVVDGYDYGLSKNSLRFQLFDRDFDLTKKAKWKILNSFKTLPLKAFLTFNFDAGYSYTPQYSAVNPLNNRILYGGGIGFDILAYYTFHWRFEYSFNHLGEGNLFFSYRAAF